MTLLCTRFKHRTIEERKRRVLHRNVLRQIASLPVKLSGESAKEQTTRDRRPGKVDTEQPHRLDHTARTFIPAANSGRGQLTNAAGLDGQSTGIANQRDILVPPLSANHGGMLGH
eukprot:TRINITY_DN117787_c0_g1_i1.p2 TRINITY_DN117787_c0_g1~~TRINITY_DN117787_c0_g1_i1.p2  ORF type:complete len:115 (-),score=24.35 TRINITY_DN117787_c0_g1_i1:46-390(-)